MLEPTSRDKAWTSLNHLYFFKQRGNITWTKQFNVPGPQVLTSKQATDKINNKKSRWDCLFTYLVCWFY